jgi:hypothetical protein
MLPELLDRIPPAQKIASVTADCAFDTRRRYDAIAARGAAAILPPRNNAKPWKPDTARAVARHMRPRTSGRVGRSCDDDERPFRPKPGRNRTALPEVAKAAPLGAGLRP